MMRRIEAAAAARVEAIVARMAARAEAELDDDIRVTRGAGRLELAARRLGRRMIDDARLRAIGLRP